MNRLVEIRYLTIPVSQMFRADISCSHYLFNILSPEEVEEMTRRDLLIQVTQNNIWHHTNTTTQPYNLTAKRSTAFDDLPMETKILQFVFGIQQMVHCAQMYRSIYWKNWVSDYKTRNYFLQKWILRSIFKFSLIIYFWENIFVIQLNIYFIRSCFALI